MNLKININSILTRIIIIFIITISLFIMSFVSYFHYQEEEIKKNIHQEYRKLTENIRMQRLSPSEIISYTKNKNFILVEGPHFLIENLKLIFTGPGYEVLKKDEVYYLFIHAPYFRLMLKDLNIYKKNYTGFYILGLTLILLIFTFLWLIAALKPLKDLRKEIQKFSDGNLDINCKSDKKDEISELGNEFDKAVKKISLLLESRQLFLRTVMHELKTPIAKGRIVSELITDEKQKNRSIQIYEKLNLLIDDFAKIEQIVSQNYTINKQALTINKIIKTSKEMMMLDILDDKIILEGFMDENINADLELISLCFKNLIDNAFKYSYDKKIIIKKEENNLLFISKGPKLSKALEEYFKPFHNETKSKNHGMGLGLYIIYSILQMHNFKIEYTYMNEKNIFRIIF